MNRIIFFAAFVLVVTACQKSVDAVTTPAQPAPALWTEHRIPKGEHYSDKSLFRQLSVSEMKFLVKFDNSARYQAIDTNNQRDINKLYGFSDNNQDHHSHSARIGWRWYNNQLQLFAYVYNNGIETDQLITAVPLDKEVGCSIRAEGSGYIFTVNDQQVVMPRTAATPKAEGYQLYPYFGGDEVAPHDIRIWIKDL